jgi:protein arginine N-methyltransferase 1
MSVMTNVVLKEPCIDYLNAFRPDHNGYFDRDAIITNKCKVLDLDLVHMKKEDVNFAGTYHLVADTSATVSAIIAWFDCHFEDLKTKVTLSTSPYEEYTHWKNTIFYLDKA